MKFCPQNNRIIELLQLEGTFKIHLVQQTKCATFHFQGHVYSYFTNLPVNPSLPHGTVILAALPKSVSETLSCTEEIARLRCSNTIVLRTLQHLHDREPRECSSLNDTLIFVLPWREPSNIAWPLCSFRSRARWKFSFQRLLQACFICLTMQARISLRSLLCLL